MSGKIYPEEFNVEAVKQVLDRGYKVGDTARRLGLSTTLTEGLGMNHLEHTVIIKVIRLQSSMGIMSQNITNIGKNKEIQISAVARMFSASVLKELANKGKSPLLARLIRESNLLHFSESCSQIYELFQSAFSYMKHRNFRHEYIYKAALTEKVLLGIHSLQTASMITEFRVGDRKADVVILNGTGSAYEIKSERDTLSRLEGQISAYMKVFAQVHVIVGDNHLSETIASVPKEVGVLKLSDRYQISTIRDAKDMPERTCPLEIFDSISLREAKSILVSLEIDIPDVPNTQQYKELRTLFSKLDPKQAHTGMVVALKKHRSLAPLNTLIKELPKSLHAAVLSTRLRKQDHQRLVFSMNTPVNEAIKWG